MHFHDDESACRLLEGIRWSAGRACRTVALSIIPMRRRQRNGSIVHRCAEKACRKDFTVTTKSVMEASHIVLPKWLQGFYQMSSSNKGVSSHQLHRSLGITYKAAGFMTHRIREAMREGGLKPMGGEGKIVEADETYSVASIRPTSAPRPPAAVHSPRAARPPTSAPSSRWSSVAVPSVPSMSP
jgi:hypothetical protein